MPEFDPGEDRTALVVFSNRKDVTFNCRAFLYIGGVEESQVDFLLDAREEKEVSMPVTMPESPATYAVTVAVYDLSLGLLVERESISITIREDIMPQGVRAHHNANQSIPNMLNVDLSFNSEEYDTDNIHSSPDNRHLVCRTAGIYFMKAQAMFQGNNNGYRMLTIRCVRVADPGTSLPVCTQMIYGNTTPYACYIETSTLWPMAVGDYVKATVYQSSGSALIVYGGVWGGYPYSPVLAMQRVG